MTGKSWNHMTASFEYVTVKPVRSKNTRIRYQNTLRIDLKRSLKIKKMNSFCVLMIQYNT